MKKNIVHCIHRLRQLMTCVLLCITLVTLPFQSADMGIGKGNPFELDMSNLPKNGLMPMPSEKEMQEIEKFLSTLSEDEINELIKYGEDITRIAEENNIPLFFDAPTKTDSSTPSSSAPLNTENKLDTKKPSLTSKVTAPEVLLTKDDVAYYKKILENLLNIVQTIRQRASSIKKFEHYFKDFEKNLDSLVYYLHVLQKENLMLHLKDKKYESLVNVISSKETQLSNLNNDLELPSVELLYNPPFSSNVKKQLKNAEKVLASIKKCFSEIFLQDNIITTIETLLKEYEPLALQVKQKNDEKEKAAHEFIKKIPVSPAPKQIPAQPGFNGMYQPPRQTGAPVSPKPLATTAPVKNAPLAPQKPNKFVEPVKKSQPPKAKKATFADLEKEIVDTFENIERKLVPHRAHINDFLTTYGNNKTEPDSVTSVLTEANFELKKAKTLVEEWYKKLEKEATSKTDMEKKAKAIQDLFKNNARHNNLKAIHAKTKIVAKTGSEGSVKRFKDMMDAIEKRVTELF